MYAFMCSCAFKCSVMCLSLEYPGLWTCFFLLLHPRPAFFEIIHAPESTVLVTHTPPTESQGGGVSLVPVFPEPLVSLEL